MANVLNSSICEKCSSSEEGEYYVFWYGHHFGTESGSSITWGGMIEMTSITRYRIEGKDRCFICRMCLEKERNCDVMHLGAGLAIVLVCILFTVELFGTLSGRGYLILLCSVTIAVYFANELFFKKVKHKRGSELAIEAKAGEYTGRGYNLFLTPKQYEEWQQHTRA